MPRTHCTLRSVLAAACLLAGASSGAYVCASHPQRPVALASALPLRGLSFRDVAAAAAATDLARALLAAQDLASRVSVIALAALVPLDKIVADLLRRKAQLLHDIRDSQDNVILHIAPSVHSSWDALPHVVESRASNEAHGRMTAVIISPAAFVGHSALERYGAALVAGMRLWQEYLQSLNLVTSPPLPSADTTVSEEDLVRIDRTMGVLGRICELADKHQFDVILCLSEDEGISALGGKSPPQEAKTSSAELRFRSSPGFNCAVAVAHIATCLARAFSSPNPQNRDFPSILLSAESTRHLHAVDLLAQHTLLSLRLRLAPASGNSIDDACVECAVAAPAVLSLPGLQHVPATISSHPIALEYTRGIGDLQVARLRSMLEHSAARHRLVPYTLVRREFAGDENDLFTASARLRFARNALRSESAALWSRLRYKIREGIQKGKGHIS